MYNLLATWGGATVNLVALIVIIGSALLGYSKGFVKMFVAVFGTILALLLSVILAPSVAKFMESEHLMVTNMSNSIADVLTRVFGDSIMNTTLEEATHESLKEAGLGGNLIRVIMASREDTSIPMDTTLNQIICPTFAYYVVMVLAVLVLFILFKMIFFITSDLINKMHKFKMVASVDKGLGCVLGFIRGVILIEIIIMICGIIPLGFMQSFYATLTNVVVTGFIEKISLFNAILRWISRASVLTLIKTLL